MMTELKSQTGGANKEIDTACHLEGQIEACLELAGPDR